MGAVAKAHRRHVGLNLRAGDLLMAGHSDEKRIYSRTTGIPSINLSFGVAPGDQKKLWKSARQFVPYAVQNIVHLGYSPHCTNPGCPGEFQTKTPNEQRQFGIVMYVKMVCNKCGLVGWEQTESLECADCDRLMVECERVGLSYTTAMKALIARRETARASEYIRLRAATDETRIDYEVAVLELERPRLIHAACVGICVEIVDGLFFFKRLADQPNVGQVVFNQ